LSGAFTRGLARIFGVAADRKDLGERPGKVSNLAGTPYTKPKFPFEMLYKVGKS
jgi:hypothetical protein